MSDYSYIKPKSPLMCEIDSVINELYDGELKDKMRYVRVYVEQLERELSGLRKLNMREWA